MGLYNKKTQILTVGFIHFFIILTYSFICISFWKGICGKEMMGCFETSSYPVLKLIFLSFFRPFFFMPFFLFPFMIGMSFPFYETFLLSLLSGFFSLLSVTLVAKLIGKRFVAPWLLTNFPKTLSFVQVQESRLVFFSRLVPLIPFDLITFTFGLLDFKLWKILFLGFCGFVLEALILSYVGTSLAPFSYLFLAVLPVVLSLFVLILVLFFKIFSTQRERLYSHYENMKKELQKELELTRTIVEKGEFNPDKRPVLLLYGFFASRSSLINLERILTSRGYEILSFNLGGLFEVFFTEGIIEAAHHLDRMLKEIIERHKIKELTIVAHSKGGLVALWWLQKLGGYKYCNTLITMGTPFRGSPFVWLGLFTPIGFFFRDLWQMRAGSSFLRYLNSLVLPENLQIYSFYSNRDTVVRGKRALLIESYNKRSNVKTVPMHHVSHYGYLHRKDIGDTLVKILSSPYYDKKS